MHARTMLAMTFGFLSAAALSVAADMPAIMRNGQTVITVKQFQQDKRAFQDTLLGKLLGKYSDYLPDSERNDPFIKMNCLLAELIVVQQEVGYSHQAPAPFSSEWNDRLSVYGQEAQQALEALCARMSQNMPHARTSRNPLMKASGLSESEKARLYVSMALELLMTFTQGLHTLRAKYECEPKFMEYIAATSPMFQAMALQRY